MSAVSYKTEYEIQQLGIEALRKGIGVVGLIRFMQQFDKGHGNYVEDRRSWQENYTVDTLLEAIKKERHSSGIAELHSAFCRVQLGDPRNIRNIRGRSQIA